MARRELSESEVEKWTSFAREFRRAQQKLLNQKGRVESALQESRSVLAGQTAKTTAWRYMHLQVLLLEATFRNLDALPLTVDVYEPFIAIHTAGYQARELEQVWLRVQLEAVLFEELAQLLEVEQQAKGLSQGLWPDAFEPFRAACLEQPELLERYRVAWVNLRQGLRDADTLWRDVGTVSTAQARLSHLQKLNIPALNGLAYRVRAALRSLPSGELLLNEMRHQVLSSAQTVCAQPVERSLTDRIRRALRPTKSLDVE